MTGLQEIQHNQAVAKDMDLQRCDPSSVVTPDLSGLTNAQFRQCSQRCPYRFLVSDTSRSGWANPTFNTGITSPLEPDVLIVPRHPTNLFYNVSLPEEWVAQYNSYYRAHWLRDLSYARY